jgi:Uma2 family endonuclease
MTVMVETPGDSRRWTLDQLDQLPDDGNRYELLDGELLVSPAPVPKHQLAVLKLGAALLTACPEGLMALVAPVDWRPGGQTSLQPDVLVVSKDWLDATNITDVLPLAVEVMSPSTRRVDLVKKWAKYESAGVGRTGWSIRTCRDCWRSTLSTVVIRWLARRSRIKGWSWSIRSP